MKNNIWKSDSFLRTGLRHLDKSQPCQDSVLMARLGKNGDDLFILCDGISSCDKADQGSKEAAKATRDYFVKKYEQANHINRLLASPNNELKQIQKELISTIKQRLAEYPKADTTLTFVWLINARYALIGFIGDSAVCVFSENKSVVLTQSNDYGGATESVRNSRAAELISIRLIDIKSDKVTGFLMTSDGLEGVLYSKGKRARALHICEDCVNTLFEENGHTQVESFLDEVCADGSFDDDISLIIAACEPVSIPDDPTWLCACGTRNHIFSTICEKCGRDYFSIYGKTDMSNYPSAWEYFQYLNSHPEEEHIVISHEKVSNKMHIEDERAIYLDDSEYSGDKTYDVVGFVEYHGHRSDHLSKGHVEPDYRESHNPNRAASSKRHTNRKNKRQTMLMPKRIAVIGSAIMALLCGVLVINFFQILSISTNLQEMREEIDRLKGENPTLAVAKPTEVTSASETTSLIRSTEGVTTALPTQSATEPVAELQLSVEEVVALYPEHDYQHDAIDHLTPKSNIELLRRETVDGVDWAQVKSSSGIIGWAPYEYLTPVDQSNEQTDATEQTEP